MEIGIRAIAQDDYERVHAVQCEYLDSEDYTDFERRIECRSVLYFVAVDGDELAGICYGHPSRKDESVMILQGIAVNLDCTRRYARQGIGSEMLRCFESAAKDRGCKTIGVGSAEDSKVERFYLKNGYKAIELVAKGAHHEELERIRILDYEVGKVLREELRVKHSPREIIFIFEKPLP